MNRRMLGVALAALVGSALASANPFTQGNLVIYRVGDGPGGSNLLNTGNTIYLDEYTTTGSLVQSINVSAQSASGFIASGTATSEGMMTLSGNGQFLTMGGYVATPGGAALPASASATINRAVVNVGMNGLLANQTNLSDYGTASNPRGQYSTNGVDLWLTSGVGGVIYNTTSGGPSTTVSTTTTNLRNINAFNGQLYVSTGSGTTFRIGQVGSGTPNTTGQTITNIPGGPTSGSPYGFYFFDLDAGVAGNDTLYVSDDTATTGGIFKYSLVGGTWVSNGSVLAASARGLTGFVGANGVNLFATTGASTAAGGGTLYGFTDTSGYNGTLSGSVTTLASASASTAFRGIAYIPQAVPEPGSMIALGLGAIALIRKRRNR